jgi:mono/diheme cytochrome c family protein
MEYRFRPGLAARFRPVPSILPLLLMVVGLLGAVADAGAQGGTVSDDVSAHSAEILRGRNIVLTVNCNDCHTPGYATSGGNVPEDKWLLGDPRHGFSTPQGVIYAPNLRAVMAKLTESQWVEKARHLKKRPPMPQHTLRSMSESDLKALYWFIRSLGPGGR